MSAPAIGLTPANLAAREGKLTASDWAAALGYHPFKTPLQLYREKRGEAEATVNWEPAEIGHLIESAILSIGVHRTGLKIQPNSDFVVHPEFEWAGCTPDAFSDDDGTVDAKNVGARMAHHWDNDAPVYYDIQRRIQIACTRKKRGHLFALIGGNDFRVYTIERDEEYERYLLAKGREFMERVWNGEPPEATAGDIDQLLGRYPQNTKPFVTPTDADKALIAEYRVAKEAADKVEKVRKDLYAKLIDRLGDAEGLEGLCTFRKDKDSIGTDWEAVCMGLGVPVPADLIVKHQKVTRNGPRKLRLLGEK